MKLLNDRIRKDGKVFPGGVLKVNSFLNHQVDPILMTELAKEFKRIFDGVEVTKILTAEVSGIAPACFVAKEYGVPLVFAKKSRGTNMAGDVYVEEVFSFTHNQTYQISVSKDFLSRDDKILIIDDFLAKGNALACLVKLARQSGAEVVGCGTVIEKTFQGGAECVRELGVRVESLAKVTAMTDEAIELEE